MKTLAAIVVASVLFACERDGSMRPGERASPGGAGRHESAQRGTEVPSDRIAPSVTWAVSEDPVVHIGPARNVLQVEPERNDPAHDLFQVRGAYRLSDGRLVIANAGSRELRFYSATGEYLSSAGRRGEGPGELLWIDSLLVLPDDSLVVVENRRGNLLTIFDREGRYSRSFKLAVERSHWVVGVFSTGEVLAVRNPFRSIAPGEAAPEGERLSLVSFTSEGEPVGTVLQLPAAISYDKSYGREHVGLPAPFRPEATWSVRHGRLAAGYGDRFEIGIYDPGGQLVRTVAGQHERRPVTGRSVAKFRARFAGSRSPEMRKLGDEILDAVELPEHLPAFGRLWLDDLGMLWVQDYSVDPPRDQAGWTVFDGQGRAVARAHLPPGLRITHIDEGSVMGVVFDTLGVEHVLVHRLTREGQ